MSDPYTTRSLSACAFLLVFGIQPCAVSTLPMKAGQSSRPVVEFRYNTEEARDRLADWYQGDADCTLVPAKRFDAALFEARRLANLARDRAFDA